MSVSIIVEQCHPMSVTAAKVTIDIAISWNFFLPAVSVMLESHDTDGCCSSRPGA